MSVVRLTDAIAGLRLAGAVNDFDDDAPRLLPTASSSNRRPGGLFGLRNDAVLPPSSLAYVELTERLLDAVAASGGDGLVEAKKRTMRDHLHHLERLAVEFDRNTDENIQMDEEAKWSACLALVSIFKHTTEKPGRPERTQIEAAFGSISDLNMIKRAAKCINDIRSMISNDHWSQILKRLPALTSTSFHFKTKKNSKKKAKQRKAETDDGDESRPLFGELFPVVPPNCKKAVNYEHFVNEMFWPNMEFEATDLRSQPMNFIQLAAAGMSSAHDEEKETGRRWKLTMTSLVQELESAFGGAEDANLISNRLFELLESDHSNEQLQGELLDLLGFEQFDLLGKILDRRQELVIELQKTRKAQLRVGPDDYMGQQRMMEGISRDRRQQATPSYCQQIVVQSQLEADLQREMRREKKREKKEMGRIEHAFSNDEKLAIELANLDATRQRELDFLAAQAAPLFVRDGKRVERVKYPYVFDALAECNRVNMTFNNLKFALPEGTERYESRAYEEVSVPAVSSKNRPKVGEPVIVAEMDGLAQKAFAGIERLNVIQSVVFEQAYRTKENLLICAPTGAGKTNIAMLAVLQTIRAHMKGDQISKGDFKIVYVAPMKALATEMTRSFGERLKPLGIQVRELTGDTQLTKKEIAETQMLVVTPEKWDVITRKSTGDVGLSLLVRLLIIDEVHLLHDDRGPVIETLVARTLRQVEMTQNVIRIVGLSATLPNYVDVANFLRVNPYKGLFFFDGRFRPVPLTQTFIGVKSVGSQRDQLMAMDIVCYEKVVQFVRQGHQVLVFVHARNATGKLATFLRERASNEGDAPSFEPDRTKKSYLLAQQAMSKSRNRQLQELFPYGFGCHHAGMVRSDRILIEKIFAEGNVRVLCCTATLAWGVNLPAHAVVIRGTEIYDAEKGAFVDIGVLDVQQIFGRAGRPQFDTSGHGIIITQHAKMYKYIAMLTSQVPIESQFTKKIADNLNAEIALGTVTTLDEGVEWLRNTYFYVRAMLNPLVYGLTWMDLREKDPDLYQYRKKLIETTAQMLDKFQMIRFDDANGYLYSTDLGRIASNYYIRSETIEMLLMGDAQTRLLDCMTDDAVLNLVAHSKEFEQLKVRDEEMNELDDLLVRQCHLPVKGGAEQVHGKANCLMQAHISRAWLSGFSLVSDAAYVAQNVTRLCRAFFEVALRRNYAQSAAAILQMAKCLERKQWPFESPLRQVSDNLRTEWIEKIEKQPKIFSFEKLRELDPKELGAMLSGDGRKISDAAWTLPVMQMEMTVRPVTRTILQLRMKITADFNWNLRHHGRSMQGFWIWIENTQENRICHHEYLLITKKQVDQRIPQELSFTIPVSDKQLHEHNFYVRILSDYWICPDTVVEVPMRHLQMPDSHKPQTDLLNLHPLPTTALHDERLQNLYPFPYFNAIQTQVFHCLFHSDKNALIGAPTGSGKTVCAELAMFKVFREHPEQKCVYIAPLKALVRERVKDWQYKFGQNLGKSVIELTGDVTPDAAAIQAASVIITTPEKWDGISRQWATREYVRKVALVVVDEIHLLGVDRGPILEVIIARMNIMAKETRQPVRIVGLSTALANAGDVAHWLGINKKAGFYNFRPEVRPVPISVHIRGFPGKHYCPRMALMNKPAFIAIKTHSPTKPVLIFVASRRQTRLTAMDLIALLAAESNRQQWLHMEQDEVNTIIDTIRDQNLKLSLAFGIGLHHAGLHEHDRNTVEQLFLEHKIQVLVATATLAWGINMPAHLVIVKGTEYFDGKLGRYVDFPVTDVLQMMGRAGRPQFDDSGVAVIFVQDVKKAFYKTFLYDPFPVESSLQGVLADHINAEIVAGTIKSKQGAMEYVTWTYLFRRLMANPSYYGLTSVGKEDVGDFLSSMIDDCLKELMESSCIQLDEDERSLIALNSGTLASYYYLTHLTMRMFRDTITANSSVIDLLKILTDAHEYDEIPVRHNEDLQNAELQKLLPVKLPAGEMDSSHVKAHLLLQAHFSRVSLTSDYRTDLKSVLDQSLRILQAMLDMASDFGWFATAINTVSLIQMTVQGRWINDSPVTCLPNIDDAVLAERFAGNDTIPLMQTAMGMDRNATGKGGGGKEPTKMQNVDWILKRTGRLLEHGQAERVVEALSQWPILRVCNVSIRLCTDESTRHGPSIALNLGQARQPLNQQTWTPVDAGGRYLMGMRLERLGKNRRETRAYAPHYPKPKEAGWIIMLGVKDTGELVAMKRVPAIGDESRHVNVEFTMPEKCGRLIYDLMILSDSYLGIDQQYRLLLDVCKKQIDCNGPPPGFE